VSFDSILLAGPISLIVEAILLPNKLDGIKLAPAGKFRIMFPIILFAGKLLNAALICAIRVPAGHVIDTTESPAGTMQVQGDINAAVGHATLKLTPSTNTEINFARAGKFLGGFAANGVFEHRLRKTLLKTLNPVRKL